MPNSITESRKRKLIDSNKFSQEKGKRQSIQNTLQYFFQKNSKSTAADGIIITVEDDTEKINSTTCPICSITLTDIPIQEYEIHVNSCLDSSDELPANNLQLEPSSQQQESVNQESFSRSWSKIFTTASCKIRGIWSHQSNDAAPGLNENEASWFGEAKDFINDEKTSKRLQVPYYKRLAGTKMVVDAFTFGEIPGCEGYLLSHFHSDHYMGLTPDWSHGPIYCSETTARLVEQKLKVFSDFIFPLPIDKPCALPGTDQLTVTLIDANHCPGAVMFLITNGNLRYLHTGDFRACPKMCLHPMLKEQPLDIVYLDTTYLDPKYSFPSQESCIQTACELVKRHNGANKKNNVKLSNEKGIDHWFALQEQTGIINDHAVPSAADKNEKLLVVVGTYSLGKENIFIEIAKSLNSKIFVTDQKRAMLDCLDDQELDAMLTDQVKDAQVHVIPLGHIQAQNLEAYFRSLQPHFSQMIAFRPTGWTFRAPSDPKIQHQQRSLESIIRASSPDLCASTLKPTYDTPFVKIYAIPYSEHSSYRELALFIASLEIRRIVPTVNVYSEQTRLRMSLLFDKWHREKNKLVQENGDKLKIIDYLSAHHW